MAEGRVRTAKYTQHNEKLGEYVSNYRIGTPCETIKTSQWLVNKSYWLRQYQEICYDEVHPDHPRSGGPLDIVKSYYTYDDAFCKAREAGYSIPASCLYRDGDIYRRVYTTSEFFYTGRFRLERPKFEFSQAFSSFGDAEDAGPRAWNKFRPQKPAVNLAVAIAELRDIGGLLFKKLTSFKALGQNYLAVQFGWRPFINDLKDFIDTTLVLTDKINQLIHNNQQWVHRSGTVERTLDVDVSPIPDLLISPNYHVLNLSCYKETKLTQRIWFSGKFKYYIPALKPGKFQRLRAGLRVLGMDGLRPSDVWALIPFSWLIDWFFHIGSAIEVLEARAFDDLVAKYAYCMCQKVVKTRHKAYFNIEYNGQTTPKACASTLVQTAKARAVAKPFGFTPSLELNLRQAAILAALGLAKS